MRIMRPFLIALSLSSLAPFAFVPVAKAQTSPLTAEQLLGALDPDMRAVVQLYNVIRGTSPLDLSPPDARQQIPIQEADKILARATGTAERPLPVGSVIDGMSFANRTGQPIPVRIYEPAGAGPFPVVMYFHGGGFEIATIDTYDSSARALCNGAGAIVVSVEYRKAPEAPFPAAHDDAVDSYKWALHDIGSYNGLPGKIAVAGESAGGNLAIEVSLAARDLGLQLPTYQLLVYPVATQDVNQASDILYTDPVLPLTTPLLKLFGEIYLQDPAKVDTPEAAPFYANLSHLPPTTIIAAQEDPLVSDGEDLYAKLLSAENKVQYKLYTGVTHEFFGMGDYVKKAAVAEAYGAAQLKGSF